MSAELSYLATLTLTIEEPVTLLILDVTTELSFVFGYVATFSTDGEAHMATHTQGTELTTRDSFNERLVLAVGSYKDVDVDRLPYVPSSCINDLALGQLWDLDVLNVVLATYEGTEGREEEIALPTILVVVDILRGTCRHIEVRELSIDLETIEHLDARGHPRLLSIHRGNDRTVAEEILGWVILLEYNLRCPSYLEGGGG